MPGLLRHCVFFLVPMLATQPVENYSWNLPKGFPKPYVPPSNLMTTAKVELGRRLFYDRGMSINGKFSCAACHKQELAFTDGRAVGVGATGELHSRGAMSLVNVAYSGVLTWSAPATTSLEEQAVTPMFGDHPLELGLREGDGFLPRLRSDPTYRMLFEAAFSGQADRFTISNVIQALACFERSINPGVRRMTVIITPATTTLCRSPPSAAKPSSSASLFPAFAATAASISVTPRFRRAPFHGPSSFTTRGLLPGRPGSISRRIP